MWQVFIKIKGDSVKKVLKVNQTHCYMMSDILYSG